jgi:hypothetical protein
MTVLAQVWGVLPLVIFGCVVIVGWARGRSWTESLLRAMPWWAAGVWSVSNLLSICDGLRIEVLRLVWLAAAVSAVIYTVKRCRCGRVTLMGVGAPRPFAGVEWVLAAGIGSLLLMALITAVQAPPSTVDVLNYHGPRQLMWLQQGGLGHFLTVNDRQLMMPPLAEVIGLQFLALTGGDYWMNLPQWFAYAMLPVVVASIVRILGGDRRQALLGAWLAVCLPMAYVEASNAKNDLQEALWITLLLREVVLARRAGAVWERGAAIRTGLVLGLAVLTKSTSFLYAPPLIVVGVLAWRRVDAPLVWRRAATAALVAMLLSTPFFARNIAWYGTPLGEHRAEDGGHQQNEGLTPAIFVSNALRGVTQHLAGPSDKWNAFLKMTVARAHDWMGISVSDSRSTCWGSTFDVVYAPYDETQAAAPWHFILMLLVMPAAFLRRKTANLRWLVWVTVAMVVLYCGVLKWQPWAPRLQQPVFVAGIVIAVLVAGACGSRARKWVYVLMALGGAVAWWPAREVAARPLLRSPSIFTTDRTSLSYRYLPLTQPRDETVMAIIRESGVGEVSILSVHDIPFLLMQKMQRELPGVHFYGAPVSDLSRNPQAIVQLGLLRPVGLYHEMGDGSRYRLVGDFVGDGVYFPEALVEEKGWHERLPAFAGWIKHWGLRFHEETLSVIGERRILRELDSGGAEIEFSSESNQVRVVATVAKSDVGQQSLKIGFAGELVSEVALSPSAGVQAFDCLIACRIGINRLQLVYTGRGKPLNFLRLQLNDVDAK